MHISLGDVRLRVTGPEVWERLRYGDRSMCFKLRYLCVVANRRGREFLVDQLLHEFLHHAIGYPGQQIAAETGIEPLVSVYRRLLMVVASSGFRFRVASDFSHASPCCWKVTEDAQ